MFDLVADLDSYPQFVPLCEKMVVRSRTPIEGGEIVMARMTVAYGFLRESFTSRVTLKPADLTIGTEGVEGPFSYLTNTWSFEPLDEDECQVRFAIDYEFRSRTLGRLIGGLFDRAFRRFAAAFEQRADVIYGRG